MALRALKMANKVDPSVEMGFHLCYGDAGHKHFVGPTSTEVIVNVANAILKGLERRVQWFHMPVPKDRDDMEYFAPLRELKLAPETMLYLGLVHANDHDGTMRRTRAAEQVSLGHSFGIATECGIGRTPVQEFESVFQVLNELSDPVR